MALANHAVEAHRRRLAEYEAIATDPAIEDHQRRTLEMGLEFERMAIAFWENVASRG